MQTVQRLERDEIKAEHDKALQRLEDLHALNSQQLQHRSVKVVVELAYFLPFVLMAVALKLFVLIG